MPYGIQQIQQHCMAAVKEMFVLLLLFIVVEYSTNVVGFIDVYKPRFVKVLSMYEITIVRFICLAFIF
jgi:hypothetical protein